MIISEYINQLNPILGDTWSLDEMMLNVKNTKKTGKGFYDWLWSAIDPKTRFLIATKISKGRHISDAADMLESLKENAGKKPDYIVTDRLPAYGSAIRDFGEGKIQHITSKPIKETYTNMPIERYHNELRENLKSRRGLGNDASVQIYMELLRIHHNFIRPHMGLDEKTPAEKAGLEGFSDSKYLGIIKKAQNAKTTLDKRHIIALGGPCRKHTKTADSNFATR